MTCAWRDDALLIRNEASTERSGTNAIVLPDLATAAELERWCDAWRDEFPHAPNLHMTWESPEPTQFDVLGYPSFLLPGVRLSTEHVYRWHADRSTLPLVLDGAVHPFADADWDDFQRNSLVRLPSRARTAEATGRLRRRVDDFRDLVADGRALWWALRENDELRASAGALLADDTALIVDVLTAPEHERRGYATRLCRHVLHELAARAEIRRVVLSVQPQSPVVSLYRRLGFRRCGYWYTLTAPAPARSNEDELADTAAADQALPAASSQAACAGAAPARVE